ncbi:MAG: DUF2115 domain-containing protein [Methanobacterium sp.]|nr:DUF2115 domain-containing protein [Methanobacterium sp.]
MTINEFQELAKLNDINRLSKDDLLSILKIEASSIDIQKIIKATAYLREDARFMPSPYREDYIKRFSKAFFTRIKDIKDDKNKYEGHVDVFKLKEFLKVLKKQRKEAKSGGELCFLKIARIVALYTTFILEESIHPVGTKFPGGFELRLVNGCYLCPVKEKQMNNPSALCRFCVSIQDESVK